MFTTTLKIITLALFVQNPVLWFRFRSDPYWECGSVSFFPAFQKDTRIRIRMYPLFFGSLDRILIETKAGSGSAFRQKAGSGSALGQKAGSESALRQKAGSGYAFRQKAGSQSAFKPMRIHNPLKISAGTRTFVEKELGQNFSDFR